MNKKERVKAVFMGQEPDRVPVCMWQHVPEEFWDDDDAFVKCQTDFLKATDVDFMKLSGDKFFGWPDPILNNIQSADELWQMKPLAPDHPWLRSFIERTKKVVDAINGECYTFMLIYVPLSYLRLQVGYPMMMKLIRENPEAMKHATDVIAESVKYLIDGLIDEAGVDGCFYSVQNAEWCRFTEEEYLDWVRPAEKKLLDYMNTKSDMNIIHFCAWEEEPNRLSVWKDYKAPVISWSRYIDVYDMDLMRYWTGGAALWGGFDNRPGTLLYEGTREEIEAEVKSLLKQGGKTGYILGSDCSIHNELPVERIAWVVEAVKKFSK